MQARIIDKNNDFITFKTDSGDYGYLEIIGYNTCLLADRVEKWCYIHARI